MPSGPAARFESNQVLVAQLLDHLPRGEATLSGRADRENSSAGPLARSSS